MAGFTYLGHSHCLPWYTLAGNRNLELESGIKLRHSGAIHGCVNDRMTKCQPQEVCTCVYIYAHTCTYICIHMCAHIPMYVHNMHTYLPACLACLLHYMSPMSGNGLQLPALSKFLVTHSLKSNFDGKTIFGKRWCVPLLRKGFLSKALSLHVMQVGRKGRLLHFPVLTLENH